MALPFSQEQFLDVFTEFNQAVWPLQVAAYLLGAIAVISCLRPGEGGGRLVAGILGAFWLCNGLIYHIFFFAKTNSLANSWFRWPGEPGCPRCERVRRMWTQNADRRPLEFCKCLPEE